MHIPHNWVILHIKQPKPEPIYKVLAGWSGGYLDGDYWRMNSGIKSVEVEGDNFIFHGHSGSSYTCHKDNYGLKMNNARIYNLLKEELEDDIVLMDEDTDWTQIDWDAA